MAKLFGSVLGNIAGSLFLRGLSEGPPPDTVLEVKPEAYARQPVFCREESLIIYGPAEEGIYDIVLQKDYQASLSKVYSLFRSNVVIDVESKFVIFKQALPPLLECGHNFCTRDMLQKFCDILKEHPTWLGIHIASHLGLMECLKHSAITNQANEPAWETGETAILVAVRAEQSKVVQSLLGMDVHIDIADINGNTPFHAAAVTSKDVIQALSSKSTAMINHRNKEGQTPLHLSCLADKPECVKALMSAGADVNVTGTYEFPIHTALQVSSTRKKKICLVRKPSFNTDILLAKCAKEIIDMYPDQLHCQDMKYGGTPLHWSKGRLVVEALVELGCWIEAKNFKGETALHVMVLRTRLPCVVALLCHGANVNATNEEGDTPLHLAVGSGNLAMVLALIVFGANVDVYNNKGENPRHLAATSKLPQKDNILYVLNSVGAKRCNTVVNSCTDGCRPDGSYYGIPPDNKTQTNYRSMNSYDELLSATTVIAALTKRRQGQESIEGPMRPRGRLLCLDGGGIRGLVLIQMLIAIEEAIGKPILHAFDWIVGTSTGGILTLALTTGKTARECQALYFRLKDKIFIGHRPYSSEPLEQFLQKELGSDTKMSDITHPKVMVTGVLADRHPAELHLFRNYPSPASILGTEDKSGFQPPARPEDQLVWRAARASGAAPTYFRASGRFVDGGLIANNPTLDAITEICQYNAALRATAQEHAIVELECVVSLGTGRPPVTPVNAIDVFRPESIWDAARMAMGVSALGNLLVDQVTAADGRVVERARAWCSMIGVPYFRLSPTLSKDLALDETDDTELVRILWETMIYMQGKQRELQEMAQLLS